MGGQEKDLGLSICSQQSHISVRFCIILYIEETLASIFNLLQWKKVKSCCQDSFNKFQMEGNEARAGELATYNSDS